MLLSQVPGCNLQAVVSSAIEYFMQYRIISLCIIIGSMASAVTNANSYLIMIPAPQTSPYLGQWLRIAHRFNGEISKEADKDALGLDYGAQVRLQWDWIRKPGQQFSLSRSSPAGRAELGWRQTWQQHQAFSLYSWHSLVHTNGVAVIRPQRSINHSHWLAYIIAAGGG